MDLTKEEIDQLKQAKQVFKLHTLSRQQVEYILDRKLTDKSWQAYVTSESRKLKSTKSPEEKSKPRSFQYASPRLWNQLPAPLRQPRTNLSNSASPSFLVAFPPSALSTHHSHHPSPLHSSTPGLKLSFSANLSHHSLPFLLLD